MFMLYAIAAPVWLLSVLVGLALFASPRTRKLAPYVILIPTLGYWTSLLGALAVLLLFRPFTEAVGLSPGDVVFGAIFVSSTAIAGLSGMALGGIMALRFSRAMKVR